MTFLDLCDDCPQPAGKGFLTISKVLWKLSQLVDPRWWERTLTGEPVPEPNRLLALTLPIRSWLADRLCCLSVKAKGLTLG